MRALTIAGVLSALVALLHFAVIFMGAPAYRYLGAGERMAVMAERGSPVPGAITLVLTAMFAVWSAYAFSGAGLIPRLALLRTGLLGIGLIYTLRGFVVFAQVFLLLRTSASVIPIRHVGFSAVSLVIGLCYLIGTWRAWERLTPPRS
jgi:hypothetical protein